MSLLPEVLFYDGHCGLCHRAVQFVARHDREGGAFYFAPLQGSTFEAMVPSGLRAGLPDSLVLLTVEGRLLFKSDAWLHIMRSLGGAWKLVGGVCSLVPRKLRDYGYDLVAKVRFRLFARKDDMCPTIAPALRFRFLP